MYVRKSSNLSVICTKGDVFIKRNIKLTLLSFLGLVIIQS